MFSTSSLLLMTKISGASGALSYLALDRLSLTVFKGGGVTALRLLRPARCFLGAGRGGLSLARGAVIALFTAIVPAREWFEGPPVLVDAEGEGAVAAGVLPNDDGADEEGVARVSVLVSALKLLEGTLPDSSSFSALLGTTAALQNN